MSLIQQAVLLAAAGRIGGELEPGQIVTGVAVQTLTEQGEEVSYMVFALDEQPEPPIRRWMWTGTDEDGQLAKELDQVLYTELTVPDSPEEATQ